ncbi:MAG: hypothetical protein ABIR32_09280 [Ilumatobacteraceae bacterium]
MQIHRAPHRFISIAVSVAALVGLSACGSDQKSVEIAVTTSSVATASPPAAPPVASALLTEDNAMFGPAVSAACDTDRPSVELALQAYLVINGDGPVAEADLVTAGLLREESLLYDLAPGNLIVPSPGGGCTS